MPETPDRYHFAKRRFAQSDVDTLAGALLAQGAAEARALDDALLPWRDPVVRGILTEDPDDREERLARRARYDDLQEQIDRAWGERALAVELEDDGLVEFYAETPSHQLVQAWPDFLDEPALKTLYHQTLANEVRWEQEQDGRRLVVVDWEDTPFPDDPDDWPFV